MKAIFLVVLLGLAPGLALAGDERGGVSEKEAARRLYTVGMRRYNLNDFVGARKKFQEAYLIVSDPSFLFNIGQCSRQLGEVDEALKSYRTFLRERPETPNRVAVERFISDLERELQRRLAARPPTGTEAPARTPSKAPLGSASTSTSSSTSTSGSSSAAKATSAPSRAWVGAVVAVVVVVVAGGAVGGAVAGTVPRNAPEPSTTAGTVGVSF